MKTLNRVNKTHIIATIRDTYSEEKLIAIAQAGVNIVRFNFSHAKGEFVKPLIDKIHQLNREGVTDLGILLDTKGPEVRTGERDESYEYQVGEQFRIFVDKEKMTENSDLLSDYPYLLEDLHVGDSIAIESGLMSVIVKEVTPAYLVVESKNHCTIGSKRHMNFPGIKLRLPGLTEKDKKDLLFGIENGINYIAASFIRNKENIQEIRTFLKEHHAEQIKIISKIENQEGLDNLDDIVEYSDAVMIARGDLGIEIPIETLPYYQSKILEACEVAGKPVVMATELLKSMVNNSFPTRAEVSDVYHAVLEGAHCVMLSDETAAGDYPVEAVTIMRKTVTEAEKHMEHYHPELTCNTCKTEEHEHDAKESFFHNALYLADDLGAKAVLIASHEEKNAELIAGLKPSQPVYYFTDSDEIYHMTHHLFGIQALHTTFTEDFGEQEMVNTLQQQGVLTEGDQVVILFDGEEFSTTPQIKIIES